MLPVTDDRSPAAPPIQASISVELSRAGLTQLRGQIDELLSALADASATADEIAATSADKTQAVWAKLGTSSREYLLACASFDEPFTLDQVVDVMGLDRSDIDRVRAYHRNVSRSAGLTDPRGTPLMTGRRRGARTQLTMASDVRASIQQLAKQS